MNSDSYTYCICITWDTLQDLIPLVQFIKSEKFLKVTLHQGVFYIFNMVQMVPNCKKHHIKDQDIRNFTLLSTHHVYRSSTTSPNKYFKFHHHILNTSLTVENKNNSSPLPSKKKYAASALLKHTTFLQFRDIV